jgi:hypothetical protein
MMNATKLAAAGGLCMLCCALPISAVLAGGIFQVGAASWGIAGGVALLAAAAVGALLAGRRRPANPGCNLANARPRHPASRRTPHRSRARYPPADIRNG